MNLRPKAVLYRRVIGIILSCILINQASTARGAELTAEEADLATSDGKVDVIYAPNLMEPYRERRGPWAYNFGISLEDFHPKDFIAGSDGSTYEAMFGEVPIRLAQASLGLKYNFFLGSLSLDGLYGTGKIFDEGSGLPRSLSITKRGLNFGWTLDSIFLEPYVAPYLNVQVFELDFVEAGSSVGDKSGTTAPTSGYSFGLLFQLNSVDPTDAARVANAEYGLNNTYLDIFAAQYNTSTAETDPQFETSMSFGAGLRLEF